MENEEPEEPKGKKKEPRKSVYAVQVGEQGYRVLKATNLLSLRVGSMLTVEQAAKLIDSGVNFTVGVNK